MHFLCRGAMGGLCAELGRPGLPVWGVLWGGAGPSWTTRPLTPSCAPTAADPATGMARARPWARRCWAAGLWGLFPGGAARPGHVPCCSGGPGPAGGVWFGLTARFVRAAYLHVLVDCECSEDINAAGQCAAGRGQAVCNGTGARRKLVSDLRIADFSCARSEDRWLRRPTLGRVTERRASMGFH